jgi:5-methylcytosine-specific restriction endonuclease McrA
MGYFIGSYEFRTKKAAKDAAMERLTNVPYGYYSIDSDEGDFLLAILENHSEYDEKVGCGIAGFHVNPALDPALRASGKGKHITFQRLDGTEDSFSYNHCLTFPDKGKKECGDRELRYALREAIRPQRREFVKNDDERDVPNQRIPCPLCNCMYEDDNPFHVDHIIPFSHLVDTFLREEQINPPKSYGKTITRRWAFKPHEQYIEDKFVEYHKRYAKYQFLCSRCNIKKGARYFREI